MQADEKQGAMLLIDGAFLTQGSYTLQKKTNRKLCLNEMNLKILFDYIEQKSKVDFHPELKHFVTAELDEECVDRRWDFYVNIEKYGVRTDIRTFKNKSANCPQKGCLYNTQNFQIKVQQEVDVAIVMKVMSACFKNQMKELVFVAGDGDFKDMLDFVIGTLNKKLIVFGWNSCMSKTLLGRAKDFFFPLDDIWEHISEPIEETKEVCKYFQQDQCKYGDRCKDLHIKQVNPEAKSICSFFLNGTCKFGDKCKDMHVLQEPQERKECVYFKKGLCNKGDACFYLHSTSSQQIQEVKPESL
jgi:uncharacterized LabA/DUF88 family protein